MALSVFTGQFALSTAAAGNTQDVTNAGMAGIESSTKVAILYKWVRRTTNGQGEASHSFGAGGAVSASNRGGSVSTALHGNTTMGTDSQVFDNACIKILEPALAGATVRSSFDLNSIITNGFRLDIDTASSPVAYLIDFVAIWGTTLTDATFVTLTTTATGNINVTTAGFEPDGAILFGGNDAAINTTTSYSDWSIGVVDKSLNNYVLSGNSDDAEGTAVTMSYCREGESAAGLGDDLVLQRGAITAWLSNGFTYSCTERDANRIYRVLCLKGPEIFAGDVLSQTNTNNVPVTGVGFTPKLLIVGSHNKTASAADTVQAQDERSLGFATASAQNYISVIDKDAATIGDVGVAQNTDGFYGNQSTAATIAIEGVGGRVSMDSDGFTYAMSDADPTNNFMWYLALGETPVAVENIPWRVPTKVEYEYIEHHNDRR